MLSAFSAGKAPAPARPIARFLAYLAGVLVLAAAIGCGAAPSQDDADAYTKYVVEQAIERYEDAGQASTIRYFNTEDGADGQWYVFIVGEDNRVRAIHPDLRDLIGEDVRTFVDGDGYPYGAVIASASESGRWVTYLAPNPARSNREQTKHSWVLRHEGLIFGSGWYDAAADSNPVLPAPTAEADAEAGAMAELMAAPPQDQPDAYAKYLVQQAIGVYETEGRQELYGRYNRSDSVDGPWYVAVADESDTIVVHPTAPELIGRKVRDAEVTTDPTGYYYGDILASASEQGRWVTYVFVNPDTGLEQTKHSWAVRRDGLLFISGWYEQPAIPEIEAPSREDVDAYTKYVVRSAVNRYTRNGREHTIAYYNTEESIDGQWYVFIADESNFLVSHAPTPANVGLSLIDDIGVDSTGYAFGPVMASAGENGRWVSYLFLNPESGLEEVKHAWVMRESGLLFGSGWYEVTNVVTSAPPRSQPDVYTKYSVDQAIGFYSANGREATIEFYNSSASVDGEWYVFIADEDDIVLAHPTVPERRGGYLRDPATRTDVTGYFYGATLADASTNGRWVTYVFVNPETNELETKHTWAIRHDGLLFGSGWYE